MPKINLPVKKKRTNYNKKEDNQKYYSTRRWRKLREFKLQNNPLCEMCEKKERVTPATEVHHIVKFSSGDNEEEKNRLAYDYNNLMSICDCCHREIHGIERAVIKDSDKDGFEKR